tara:strand:+ start:2541 stop:3059 length:519 start_codon:yes stop_codon:yes gene_type:complete
MSLNPNAMQAMVNVLVKKQQNKNNKHNSKHTLNSRTGSSRRYQRPLSNIHQTQPFTNNQWNTQKLLTQLRRVNKRTKNQINQRTNIKRTIVTTIPRALNDFQMTMSKLQQKRENAFKKVENLIQFIHNHPKFTNEEKYDLIFLYVLEPIRKLPKYGGSTFYDAMMKKYIIKK